MTDTLPRFADRNPTETPEEGDSYSCGNTVLTWTDGRWTISIPHPIDANKGE